MNTQVDVHIANDQRSLHDIEANVKAVIIEVLRLDLDASQVSHDTNIYELGADSMVTVELVFALEERFGIHFDEGELKATMLESVGSITLLLAGKVGQ